MSYHNNHHNHHPRHKHKKPYTPPSIHQIDIPWPAFMAIEGLSATPQRVIRSDRATIFFWIDGTKTIVKKHPEDAENFEQAYVYAVVKKMFGNSTRGLRGQVKSIEEMVETPLPKCLT